MIEKRRHPRKDVEVPAEFRVLAPAGQGACSFNSDEGRISNLSEGGLRLNSSRSLCEADLLKLEMTLPESGAGTRMKAYAEVTWVRSMDDADSECEAGLRFMGIQQKDVDVISRLIEKKKLHN